MRAIRNSDLKKLANWKPPYSGIVDYLRELGWDQYGTLSLWRGRLRLTTGGWSDNEMLIGALQKNWVFWSVCWWKSERGGLFIFDLNRAKNLTNQFVEATEMVKGEK